MTNVESSKSASSRSSRGRPVGETKQAKYTYRRWRNGRGPGNSGWAIEAGGVDIADCNDAETAKMIVDVLNAAPAMLQALKAAKRVLVAVAFTTERKQVEAALRQAEEQ